MSYIRWQGGVQHSDRRTEVKDPKEHFRVTLTPLFAYLGRACVQGAAKSPLGHKFSSAIRTEKSDRRSYKAPGKMRALQRRLDPKSWRQINSGPDSSYCPEAAVDEEHTIKTTREIHGAAVYGTMMYDFAAEKPNELDAKVGEVMRLYAHYGFEWLVAKSSQRQGEPGLIPFSYVKIGDTPSSGAKDDTRDAVRRAGLPEFVADNKKRSVTSSKQQSDLGLTGNPSRLPPHQDQPLQGCQIQEDSSTLSTSSEIHALISARVTGFQFRSRKYVFTIETESCGRHWTLSRSYEDFYDLHIALLNRFPDAAGTSGRQGRTLPSMPGPVAYATQAITECRQPELDVYVGNLLKQPNHISQCVLVQLFFQPREGDHKFNLDAIAAGQWWSG